MVSTGKFNVLTPLMTSECLILQCNQNKETLMSIFNNEEIDRLREEVRALRQQVTELHGALKHIGQSIPPTSVSPQPDETDKQPAATASSESPKPSDSPTTGNITEELKAIADKMTVLSEKIDTAAYQEKLIRDMHQELMQLKKGLIEDLKKDYLTDILNICERMGDTDRHIQPDSADYDAKKAKQLVSNTYLYIRDHLSDQYSVEYFEPAPGDAYEPKAHRAIRIIETDVDDKAGKVAECLMGGFRNSETGRVLKQARITVYRKNC